MWVRLDDGMPYHPKFMQAGPEAFALFVAGLCYCNRYGTGGVIPKVALSHLLPGISGRRAMNLGNRLASNGPKPSWIEEGEQFRVHDYEVYQVMYKLQVGEPQGAAEVRRAQNAERQRRFRERRAARQTGFSLEPRRDMQGAVTGDVTRYGLLDGNDDLPRDDADQVTRDLTDGGYTPDDDRNGAGRSPLPTPHPPSRPVLLTREISYAGAREVEALGDEERVSDVLGQFREWFAEYPRQEGEIVAQMAWFVDEAQRPPLQEMLGCLAMQKQAKPEAQFWLTAERYLREQRWRDKPPQRAEGPRQSRRSARVGSEEVRPALGSDEGRRKRLREISSAAGFDPEEGWGDG